MKVGKRILGLALLSVLLMLLAMLPGAAVPAQASHGGYINARVGQDVNHYGAKTDIDTADPNVDWWLGRFSYMRSGATGGAPAFYYGEIGWYRGWEVFSSAIKVGWAYQNANGYFHGVWGNPLQVGSYHYYKVVNSQTCDGTPTTTDTVWDLCFDNTKVPTADLSMTIATSIFSGGEVSHHGVEMGQSHLRYNQYLSDPWTWNLTTSVVCTDYAGQPNPPPSGACPSRDNGPGEFYWNWDVHPPDSNWYAYGP